MRTPLSRKSIKHAGTSSGGDLLTLDDFTALLDRRGLSRYFTRTSGLSIEGQVATYVRAYESGPLGFTFDPGDLRVTRAVADSVLEAVAEEAINGIVIEAFPRPPVPQDILRRWRADATVETCTAVEFHLMHFLARGGEVADVNAALLWAREVRFGFDSVELLARAFSAAQGQQQLLFGESGSGLSVYRAAWERLPPQPTLARVTGRRPRIAFISLDRGAQRTALRRCAAGGHVVEWSLGWSFESAVCRSLAMATPLAFLLMTSAFTQPRDVATYFARYSRELLGAITPHGPATISSSWAGLDISITPSTSADLRVRPFVAASV